MTTKKFRSDSRAPDTALPDFFYRCTQYDTSILPLGIDVYSALGYEGLVFFRCVSTFFAARRGYSPQQNLDDFITRFNLHLQSVQTRLVVFDAILPHQFPFPHRLCMFVCHTFPP